MRIPDPVINRVISDNEQERAECERWWRESTANEKLQILFTITREYEDPNVEIMSRFAQLAFGEMCEKFATKED